MSDKSAIEWTDATWNPVTGCTKVSPGCAHCYALTFAERFRGVPGHYFEHGFDLQLRPDKLDQPLRWKKPRRIFVNSMSDLFHEDVPTDFVDRVFGVMQRAHWHTFQILTKRPERMRAYLADTHHGCGGVDVITRIAYASGEIVPAVLRAKCWPLPNVWLGVSVENQRMADERIPLLLQTPAAVRFVSCEPLLGPVDLRGVKYTHGAECDALDGEGGPFDTHLGWVIVGGESGPKRREMDLAWPHSLRDQCSAASVPFFFKQHSGPRPGMPSGDPSLDECKEFPK